MAVEVAGLWEFGWSAPMTEYEQWWAVLRSFEIETLNMAPVSGIVKNGVSEYATIKEIIEDKPHLTPVFVDENAECELRDFVHPDDALYIFGKANHSPFSNLALGWPAVRIDVPKTGMFWPHQALAIVMRERGRP